MKATLVKKQEGWYNLYQNDIGIGSTHAELQGYKLSLKNCQAIEGGWDLGGIKRKVFDGFDGRPDSFTVAAVERTIQIMVELMGDKKFSINEVVELCKILISNPFEKCGKTYQELTDSYFKSLQHVEWDVEIKMEEIHFGGGCYKKQPKLDATGCLILKRI